MANFLSGKPLLRAVVTSVPRHGAGAGAAPRARRELCTYRLLARSKALANGALLTEPPIPGELAVRVRVRVRSRNPDSGIRNLDYP